MNNEQQTTTNILNNRGPTYIYIYIYIYMYTHTHVNNAQ